MKAFDNAIKVFQDAAKAASDVHSFGGAAYRTRLDAAFEHVKKAYTVACEIDDKELGRAPVGLAEEPDIEMVDAGRIAMKEYLDRVEREGYTAFFIPDAVRAVWKAMCRSRLHAQEGRWIPVSERLPDAIGNYLVFNENPMAPSEIGWAFFNSDKKWCRDMGHYNNVTHWMPLPPSPTAGGGRDEG